MADIDIPFVNLGQHAQHGLRNGDNYNTARAPESYLLQSEDGAARAHRVSLRIKDAMPSVRSWREDATNNRNFYDNHQWDDHDRMLMEQSRRPALTFNEIKKVVRAICGVERLNRTEVRFVTKGIDPGYVEDLTGDLATEAVIAVDEDNDASYERSLVFFDVVVTGMGWMDTAMAFDDDPDGDISKERVPYDEMVWDPNARKPGLADTMWRARVRDMPREEFKRRWPDMIDLVEAAQEETTEMTLERYNLVTPYYSLMNQTQNPQVGEHTARKDTISVIQFQEIVDGTIYRISNPKEPDRLIELSENEFDTLKADFDSEGIPLPPYVRQTRTVHRQSFIAHGVELDEPVDLPGNVWSLICMTGEWDAKQKFFVGMLGEMLDPQKTKNKAISAALNFYLTNAKGGLLFESGAFKNEAQAKEQWSGPSAWIPLNQDGLKKIQQRTPSEMPQSLMAFFEIGMRSITESIGVNQEMLGLEHNEAGGPTQRQRISAGLAILGWLFDSFDRFKKQDASATLEFVREFLTRGQLVDIGGPEMGQAIPLLKSNLPMKYKFQLDQSIRQNPNLKAQIWQDLMPIVPALLRFNAGGALLALLKFSPLPAQVVNAIRKEIEQQGDDQGGGKGKQEPPELTAARIQKTQAETKRTLAQARALDDATKSKIAELFLQGYRLTSDIVNREADDEHRRSMDKETNDEQRKTDSRKWQLEVLQFLEEMAEHQDERTDRRREASRNETSQQ